uniref:Uncharacterized protein n=1 Tax=Panagrolaimus davidi TaxID=227884 RepID=A0A914PIL8_9BILA
MSEETKKDVKRIASNIKIPKSSPQCRFPSDVLKHMKKKASPKKALKLMKLNKFFLQEKCPFIHFGGLTIFRDSVIPEFLASKQKTYPINNLPNNIGIGDALILRLLFKAEYLSHFISKIIICDIKQLICYKLRILYDEFKFLTSSGKVKKVELEETFVTSKKDEIISYAELLGLVPSLTHLKLDYYDDAISQKFVEKICASNLERLELCRLTDEFDFEEFLTSMKRKPNLEISLNFLKSVNGKKIDAYIDKLVAAGIPDSYPPYLRGSSSQNGFSLNRLRQIYQKSVLSHNK